MRLKAVSGIMLTLLFIGMLTLAFNIQPVRASGTIYIRADGSVDPPAPISSVDNITYTFTDNISDSIVVQRDNIVIDGAGYTLQGTGRGIDLTGRSNVTIKNTVIKTFFFGISLSHSSNINVSGNNITNNWGGIYLYRSSNNTLFGNSITNNGIGVGLYGSSNNTLSGNSITNNWRGIYLFGSPNNSIFGNSITNNGIGVGLYGSSNNTLSGNSITNNWRGIYLFGSPNNSIYHNNFIDNTQQVYIKPSGYTNFWDDDYPSGGNYWSDYTGVDLYSGLYQNETGSDGIGDTPYIIGENNQDNYPLMEPWTYVRMHARSTRYPWFMFRHNLRHTGYTKSPAPRTNQTLWNYTTGGAVGSSPAVADGMVFVGSSDHNVYALDQYTGAYVWKYTTGDAVASSPAVAYGKVFVGSDDGKVYCLNASTGAHIWSYPTGDYVSSSPAVADGKVYVGSLDKKVYCLDASTGAHIWNYTTGGEVLSSPAVAYGGVFVGSDDGKVYCLPQDDPNDNGYIEPSEVIWNYTTGGSVRSSPAVADGKVYVGSLNKKVYCLDASTGAHIWNYTTGDEVFSSPAVAYGKVFVGSDDFNVYCLNASDRTVIWSYPTGGSVRSSPAVAYGKVFVGSDDGKVYCLDASTGAHIWSYPTGDWVKSSPAVADGMVFIGSNDHTVYAFGNVIKVPEDYPTIQEAINEACAHAPGATIAIAPGTYHESLIVCAPVTLLGREGSSPEFDGGGSGIAVTLLPSASGSTVAGITITNWDQGILILDSSDCQIYDTRMSLMGYSGIALEGDNAVNNLIYSNIFENNAIAINLNESSTSNTIYANTISGNEVGIDISYSSGNTIYWNNLVDNTQQVSTSNPSSNTWDAGYPSGGNYWSDNTEIDDYYRGANQSDPGSDGICDMAYSIDGNNEDNYPLTKPYGGPYDIGITNITTSKTVVCQGYNLGITAKILNYGINAETFTITAHANATEINTKGVTLTSRNSTTITFTWDTTGVPYGNYIISAYANPVPGETDTTDNTFIDSTVRVTMPGDVKEEFGVVDIYDLVYVALCYGAERGKPPPPNTQPYEPDADINGDDVIGIFDMVIIGMNYGATYLP